MNESDDAQEKSQFSGRKWARPSPYLESFERSPTRESVHSCPPRDSAVLWPPGVPGQVRITLTLWTVRQPGMALGTVLDSRRRDSQDPDRTKGPTRQVPFSLTRSPAPAPGRALQEMPQVTSILNPFRAWWKIHKIHRNTYSQTTWEMINYV